MRRRRLYAVLAATVVAAAAVWTTAAVRGRRVVALLPGPAKRLADVEERLDAVLGEVSLDHVPLAQAVEMLGRQSGASILLDDGVRATAGEMDIDVRLRNVTLGQALTVLAGYVGSGRSGSDVFYTVHDGVIVITSAAAAGRYEYARVYDVRDIMASAPDEALFTEPVSPGVFAGTPGAKPTPYSRRDMDELVVMALEGTVTPDARYGTSSERVTIHPLDGRLLVVATWRTHRQIDQLLAQFRRPRPQE
jgi:hypothetical protein